MSKPRRKKPASRTGHAVRARIAKARRPKKSSEKPSTEGRDVTGKFLPGFSGNPAGGKNIVPEEVRELARSFIPEAITRAVHWMRCDDPQASLTAIKLLFDRGLGKAIQPLLNGGNSLVTLNINGGGSIDPSDAEAVYRELCGNPSLDISGLTFDQPRAAELIEQPSLPVREPEPPQPSDTAKLYAKLGEDA